MKMHAALLAALIGTASMSDPAGADTTTPGRTREPFDAAWRFARFGPQPDGSTKPEPGGLEEPDFDDSSWRTVNTPHDWGIEGPFRADLPNNTGKLPWAGIGWYRKALTLGPADAGRRIFLDFDGAMSHPKVFVNGKPAGEWAYGYSSFRVEITDLVKFDGANVIAVRLDNPPDSSRWYPGGGIYRHVWLEKTAPVHVAHWGVFVHTPKVDKDAAEIVAETTVDNQSAQTADVTVRQKVLAPDGHEVLARGEAKIKGVAANSSGTATVTMNVAHPQLWDITSPILHTLRTTLLADGREVDRIETPFGIRKIEWSAKQGFLLNDRVVKIQGACNHHDLGALGAAFNERAAERQLEILQAMGCNAIRTSHNPPAPQLLDLCDRMGFVVMDELFDCWKLGKTPNDYHLDYEAWHERDVVNFVHRDRNHPSVILWSSGNEIREQVANGGLGDLDCSRQLAALFHREDPTRKVSAAMNQNDAMTNGFAQTVDVAGYNYKPVTAERWNYPLHLRTAPDQPFIGSETASTVSSRGVYFFPVSEKKNAGFTLFQVSSYDLYAPPWANKPDDDFHSADDLPALGGEFVWTGFDYLGEPTPFNKDKTNLLNFQNEEQLAAMKAEMDRLGGKMPSRSSYFGIVDLAGFPKDRYYLYQSRWRPELPMAHILPHWTWPGREGEVTPIHVYTSGDEAELFLNGQSLGRKKKGAHEYRLRWDDVKYSPGELKVVAYKNGRPWAEDVRRTAGAAAALKLEVDRPSICADGADLSFVTVKVVDAHGDVVPDASHPVKFSVSGPADIAGVDNGDAASLLPVQADKMKAFSGQCLVILRSRPGLGGMIALTATADGLPPATAQIVSHAATKQ